MNLEEGRPQLRDMISGVHVVSTVSCKDCGEDLGWKYHCAHSLHNEYKVGKTVLSMSKIDKLIKPFFS